MSHINNHIMNLLNNC